MFDTVYLLESSRPTLWFGQESRGHFAGRQAVEPVVLVGQERRPFPVRHGRRRSLSKATTAKKTLSGGGRASDTPLGIPRVGSDGLLLDPVRPTSREPHDRAKTQRKRKTQRKHLSHDGGRGEQVIDSWLTQWRNTQAKGG